MHDASLPAHPLTGALALGWRKARPGEDDEELHPVWPVLGAADDDPDDGDDTGADDEGGDDQDGDDADGGDGQDGQGGQGGDEDGQDDADPEGADDLGDKGKRALASMKGKWRSEREQRRDLQRRLAEKDKDGDGDGSDDAVTKATAAATAAANTRIIKAEIRAAAARKLADPRDALRFLDLDQFEVDGDGEVDAEEITDAIESLIQEKPYLAAQGGRRFQGGGDGGAAARKAGRPKQLTERDLTNMTAEQIVKAQNEGKLDKLLGG